MVLSVIIAAMTAPGLLGSQEAIRQSQSSEKREEHRARRCNLIATCVKSSHRSREINGRQIVLRNGRLWIDTGTDDGSPLGHPYAGYFLPYPDSKYEGLVTTITDVAPIMNWIYIDKDKHEARYGVRADAQPHLTGPFDCTRQDRRLTFDGWEGWCAVEEIPGLWALYFDLSDDGLKSKVAEGTRVLEIELSRKEKRFAKETEARQGDQTTKRTVDPQEDAPVDKPMAAEALVSKPGVVDTEPNTQSTEPAPLRPLKIPASIFDDPPPMVQPLDFRPLPPKTPPPAYSPAKQEEPAQPEPTVMKDEVEEAFQPVSAVARVETEEVAQPIPTVAKEETENAPQPRRSLSQNDIPSKPSSPENDSTPSPLQRSSTNEKRPAPKLNRNSGTRAVAQAQRFEAMATTNESAVERQRKTVNRLSQPNSNRGSTSSTYSNDDPATTKPQPSPTPAPLAPKAKAKAPVMRPQVIKTTSDPSAQRSMSSPRQRPPLAPRDPAVFGTEPPRAAPPARRPSEPKSPRPAEKTLQRSASQRSPREQQRPAANQPPSLRNDQSRSAPRAPPKAGRTTLGRTMTTGRSNQGMVNRMEPGRDGNTAASRPPLASRGRMRAATTGRKTTSTLFREIDNLISQDTSTSVERTGSSRGSGERDKARVGQRGGNTEARERARGGASR